MNDFYKKATPEQLRKIDETARHFGVNGDHKLVGESILWLDQFMRKNSAGFSPTDDRSQALFRMYKYFDSL